MPKHGRRAFFLESNGKAIKQPNLFYACSKSTEFVCYKNVVKNISWHCLQRYSKRRTRDPRGISTDISLFFAHTWCKIFFWCWHGGRALCCAMASQKNNRQTENARTPCHFRADQSEGHYLGSGAALSAGFTRCLHRLRGIHQPRLSKRIASIASRSKRRTRVQLPVKCHGWFGEAFP